MTWLARIVGYGLAVLTVCGSYSVLHAGEQTDTIRRHNVSSGLSSYSRVQYPSVGERFSITEPILLHGVRIHTIGTANGTFRVRILGAEGGGAAPDAEIDYAVPVTATVDTASSDTASQIGVRSTYVQFDPPVPISEPQFFVVIDSLRNVSVLSDITEVPAACECPTETYRHQVIKHRLGTWSVGSYSFLIEPVIEKGVSSTILRPLTFDTLRSRPRTDLVGMAIGDFDADGDQDLVLNGTYYASNGTAVGSVARRYEEDREITDYLSTASVTSTIHTKDDELRLVDIRPGANRLAISRWQRGSVHGMRVELPFTEAPVFTIAAMLDRSKGEVLIVGRTDQDRSSPSPSEIIVLDVREQRVEQSVALPNGYVAHSAIGGDIDFDGDIDLLVNCTDSSARVFAFVLENTNGRLTGRSFVEVSDAGVVDPPQSFVPRVQVYGQAHGIDLSISGSQQPEKTGKRLVLENGTIARSTAEPIPTFDWLSRVAGIMSVDVDGDGDDEVFMTTPDRCRVPALYARDGMRRLMRQMGLGWEAFAGVRDVMIADIDGDGTQEIIGILDGIATIANVPLQRPLGGTEVVAVADNTFHGGALHEVRTCNRSLVVHHAYGRGRSIHERAPLVVRCDTSDPHIVVSTIDPKSLHGGDTVAVFGQVKVATDQRECALRIYPNPSASTCLIDWPVCTGDVRRVTIQRQTGEVLWTVATERFQTSVIWNGTHSDGTPVASGSYVVLVETDSGVVQSQLVRH